MKSTKYIPLLFVLFLALFLTTNKVSADSAPTVTTSGPDANNYTTVTLIGNITTIGGNNVTTRGFEYGPTTSYGTTTTENGTFGTGAYTANLAGLTPNTTYHYRSYATNITGTSYGEDMSFLTTPYVWTARTSTGLHNWYSVSSSSDGTKLSAGVSGGYIYTSIDSGATWIERTSSGQRNWYAITSSSDGTKLAAVAYNGYIYTSGDSGATWTARTSAGSRYWYFITSSSDGTKLAAVNYFNGYIYTSTDSGATWTERTSVGQHQWQSITSSSDGTKIAAGVSGGYIYTSTDSGATWTEQISAGSRQWQSITSSSDGTKLASVSWNGYIYTSTDSGATWTERTFAGQRDWISVTSSSDGTKLAVVANSGYIYTSTDSGATWTERTSVGQRQWRPITSSSDGTKLAATVSSNGYVYTYGPAVAPTLTTQSASSVDTSGVTLNGNITSTGGDNPTIRGFQYGLDTNYGTTTTENGSFETGAYTANLTGLTPNTTYHYRSYAINGVGQSFGSDQTFTTLGFSSPAVTTGGPDANNYTTITLNGNITALGGNNVTTRGFEYGPTTSYGTTTTENGSFGIGSFSSSLTSLTPNTTYHYRSYATNITGTSYGEDRTFLTTPYVWVVRTSAGLRNWYSISSSLDGTKIAAVGSSGYIYTSTDSGVTWTQRVNSGSRSWWSITSSSDGTKLVAVVHNGYIYTSTDSGATWTERTSAGSRQWRSITSSSDGTKLAAVVYDGYIYTSTDSGATWTERTTAGQLKWYSITSSSDGTKLATAVVISGYIYTSTDSGATWTQRTSSGQRDWYSITSSSDGTKLLAGGYSGYIYTSTDSGATWTQRTSSGQRNWYSMTSSSDGTKLAAVVSNGYIYTSIDNGNTWIEWISVGSRSWRSITSSYDGMKLAVGAWDMNYIYTYGPATSPTLTTDSAAPTVSTATLNGNITDTGGSEPTIRGFQYGLTNSYGTNILEEGSFGQGTYSANITNLICETTYHYRAYATNGVGPSFGDDMTFTTSNCPTISLVITEEASLINPTTTTLNGNITDNGGEVSTRGFEYGQTDTYGETTIESGSFDVGSYSSEITNLICNTLYHYRSYATNSAGTSYGDDVTFTTGACPMIPTLTTESATSITQTTATLNGTITSLSGEEPNDYGFEFGETISYGTIFSLMQEGPKSVNPQAGSYSFSWNLDSLTCGNTYHYRSYATNSMGTGYGNDISFTTDCSYVGWTEQRNGLQTYWTYIASSFDGMKLIATEDDNNYIHTSNDGGITWTEQTDAGSNGWWRLASSYDGDRIIATGNDYIYTSTDGGVTWTEQTELGPGCWYSIASSSNGLKLAAGNACVVDDRVIKAQSIRDPKERNSNAPAAKGDYGYIYTSSDGGNTWTEQTNSGQHNWEAMASSADGNIIMVGEYMGSLYLSTDGGVNWTEITQAGQHAWEYIAMSSDGSKILTADPNNGYMYLSKDTGNSWTEITSTGPGYWWALSMSADGQRLVGATYGTGDSNFGDIYVSNDGGDTWEQQTDAGERYWQALVISPNGQRIIAGAYSDIENEDGGYIYTYDYPQQETPRPARTRTRSTGSSVGVISTFYQEQLNRAIATGADTTPYLQVLNQFPTTPNTSTPDTIQRTLKQGMQGDDVKALQVYLNTHGYIISLTGAGSLSNETNYFGALTKKAVIKFQLANGLVGDGVVGKLTIDKLK